MSLELSNIAWSEKYRPKKVDNVVSTSKQKILKYIDDEKSIPNFLFTSRTPGTGKTTMAKAIINDLNCDYLILNSSDDRKIETVREKIKDFVITQSSNNKRKCVFLDEADGMIKVAQEALRNMMETYSKNVFFILTANYRDKVIEPLRSRCIEIEFTKPDKEQIKLYLSKICDNEHLEYNLEGLEKLIEINYPSIRNMVNTLQDLNIQNKMVSKDNITLKSEEYIVVWKLIEGYDFIKAKEFILKNNIDCMLLNRWLFDKLINTELHITKLAKLIRVISDNEYKMKLGADAQIIFISSIIDMILILKS